MLLVSLPTLSACGAWGEDTYQPSYTETVPAGVPEYVIGIHPQRNPTKLYAVFGPMVEYINGQLQGARLVFEAARNYAAYDSKLYRLEYPFALPNPYETVKAIDLGYTVFAKMGNDDDLRGLILVRRDSPVRTVHDLKGKRVSFPAPTALAATMMPQYFLHSRGLNVHTDFTSLYVGSMESSLMNVQLGNVVAGTVYPPAWRMFSRENPALARDLKVLWSTPPLPNNALVARADVPKAVVEQVARALTTMHTTATGAEVLAQMDLTRFEAATNATYRPVRDFLRSFQASVGASATAQR